MRNRKQRRRKGDVIFNSYRYVEKPSSLKCFLFPLLRCHKANFQFFIIFLALRYGDTETPLNIKGVSHTFTCYTGECFHIHFLLIIIFCLQVLLSVNDEFMDSGFGLLTIFNCGQNEA